MNDYSWMKAVAFGKPIEHLTVDGKNIVCIARDTGTLSGHDPFRYSLLVFLPGTNAPFLVVSLEETILGDFCVSLTVLSGSNSRTKKSIVAHFDFPPDYPKFRTLGLDLIHSISIHETERQVVPFQGVDTRFTDVHSI